VDDLDRQPAWVHLRGVWARASEALDGRSRPRDAAARDALVREIEATRKDILDLLAAGQVSAPEKTILEADLVGLASRVSRISFDPPGPPVPPRTCYMPAMPRQVVQATVHRVMQRLPLLEELASTGKVHACVVAKVLDSVEADLKTLDGSAADVPDDLRESARSVLEQARAMIDRIRQVLTR
jgi:hypothetical protein